MTDTLRGRFDNFRDWAKEHVVSIGGLRYLVDGKEMNLSDLHEAVWQAASPSSDEIEELARKIAQQVNAAETRNFDGRNLPPTLVQEISAGVLRGKTK